MLRCCLRPPTCLSEFQQLDLHNVQTCTAGTLTTNTAVCNSNAVFTVGWNSMNAMPTRSRYGAQSATAVDSLQLIYAAAAYFNPQSYYQYTALTDQWTQGAPGLLDCL